MRVATDMKLSTSSSCAKEMESNAGLSSTTCIHKQTKAKYCGYHVVLVKQQEILHNFLFKVSRGTFGIPCEGKVCHSSPGMNLFLGI